ncbi:hypothetical protein DFH09DRAFT_1379492, partial [Mycena vulgaris]
ADTPWYQARCAARPCPFIWRPPSFHPRPLSQSLYSPLSPRGPLPPSLVLLPSIFLLPTSLSSRVHARALPSLLACSPPLHAYSLCAPLRLETPPFLRPSVVADSSRAASFYLVPSSDSSFPRFSVPPPSFRSPPPAYHLLLARSLPPSGHLRPIPCYPLLRHDDGGRTHRLTSLSGERQAWNTTQWSPTRRREARKRNT